MTDDEIRQAFDRIYGLKDREPYDPYDGGGAVCFIAGVACCLVLVLLVQAFWR